MTIKELKDKRAKLIADARALIDHATADGKALSAEDNAKVEEMRKDAADLGRTITQAEELDAEARLQVPATQAAVPAQTSEKPKDAFRRFLLFGEVGLSSEEREMNLTSGAYVVPEDISFYGRVQEAQKSFGGMLTPGLCTVLTTSDGRNLDIPTNDDTSNVGAIVAEEGSHASGTALTFGQATLEAYTISSKIVKISTQLLQDSAIDIEGFLARKLGERIARYQNTLFTTGTGSSQPLGVGYAPTVGRTGATGQTASVVFDDLIRLVHSVDPAYRSGAKFMLNDTTLLALSLIKDGEGRYIASSPSGGDPTRIFGFPFVINSDLPDMATSVYPILFGNFAEYYWIRQVKGLQVSVLRELYAANGQIGVMATIRCDGTVVDSGTHAVKAYRNSAS